MMPSNVAFVPVEHREAERDHERLPARGAALGIFALSLFGWTTLLAPLIALFHH